MKAEKLLWNGIINPKEYKCVALRECAPYTDCPLCDTPDGAVAYWKSNIASAPAFNAEVETCVALAVNTRRRIKGHWVVGTGTQDTILVHPREVFRLAILCAAAAIILMHNHPSGDPAPSEADIKISRDLMRAGTLLKIELLDHIIIGNPRHTSLRELGYFYASP